MLRPLHYSNTRSDASKISLTEVTPFLHTLMLRNFATAGWVFEADGIRSERGCILASPSRPDLSDVTDQDYVYFWVRDGAICAIEAVAGHPQPSTLVDDYVSFSKLVQTRARENNLPVDHACFRIDGNPRPWSRQSDGPALRIVSLLTLRRHMTATTLEIAKQVIRADLDLLLTVYKEPTHNLWEEIHGHTFFARVAHQRAFRMLKASARELGLTEYEGRLTTAIDELVSALGAHWVAQDGAYRSVLEDGIGARLNIDLVMAAVYGDLPADSKMLATAAKLREVFEPLYPINELDRQRGMGPMMGRYPEDRYDGDQSDPTPDVGHPWALCTANFAELYYRVASEAKAKGKLSITPDDRPFFQQIGVNHVGVIQRGQGLEKIISQLCDAGDRMLHAVLYHSDHLELSEQFDRENGFEKSVRNLTWSYAAFLSAVRTRRAAV